MKTKVLLRADQRSKEVSIGYGEKPEIRDEMVANWQKIINLVAELLDVPSALIMQISGTDMNVFLRSENEDNPYPPDGKDSLLHGLYCETVIGTGKELHVDNSLHHEAWKDNPDVKLNMISYYGLPIQWQDGSFFGTICALDSETNQFSPMYREVLKQFQHLIEQDLVVLELIQRLERESGIDSLTGIPNRRLLDQEIEYRFSEYQRYGNPLAVVMMDINKFKQLNDTFGHSFGDRVLQQFARAISTRIRKVDFFARYGGDEFVLVLQSDKQEDVSLLLQDIQGYLDKNDLLQENDITFSYGVAILDDNIKEAEELIDIADQRLYRMKRSKLS